MLRNTLVSRRAISGPPRDGGSSSSDDSGELVNRRTGWSAVGRLGKLGVRSSKSAAAVVGQQQPSGDVGTSPPAEVPAARNAGSCSASGLVAKVAAEDHTDAPAGDIRREYGGLGSSNRDKSVLGQMLWARGLAKAKAVVRFKQAGRQHHR
eukprot:GHUV01037940.1.p2 GENE.GHUV01037940.1~~GHUV01037940.1.p2  ORF type:complete len:151 (-),score=54.10 GHUV01037940.1:77-529(-)